MTQIIFDYRKANGEPGRYELERWQESGKYITGHCVHDGGYRTFRKDRIVEYLSQQDALDNPFVPPPPKLTEPKMQILFSGFKKAERTDLEAKAKKAGMKTVTKATKKLVFLICGPTVGSTKLKDSRELGAYILTEPQFHQMLATGELQDEHEAI